MASSRFPILITLILCGLPLHAQDLQGAEAILKRLAEQAEKPAESKDPMQLLKKQVEAFVAESDKLPPEKAAATWLSLLDAFLLLPQSGSSYNSDGSEAFNLNHLIAALPPVTAWDALSKTLGERQAANPSALNATLALFGTLLREDPAASGKAAEALLEQVEKDTSLETYEKRQLKESISEFTKALPNTDTQKQSAIERFSSALSEVIKDKSRGGYSYHYLKFPDLTEGVDPATASSLLLKALKADLPIDTEHAGTRSLAVKTALKHLNEIPNPRWDLISEVEDIPLYEALVKKFPASEAEENESTFSNHREDAENTYIALLVHAGRKTEAKALLEKVSQSRKIEREIDWSSESAERNKLAFDFLYEALSEHPGYPLWNDLAGAVSSPSEEQSVLDLQAKALAGGKITDLEIRSNLEDQRISTMLESGRTDEALRELAKFTSEARALKDKPQDSKSGALQEAGIELSDEEREALQHTSSSEDHTPAKRLNDLLVRAALMGDLLGREDLSKAAMDELVTSMNAGRELNASTLQLFVKHQRFSQLEKILGDSLLRLASAPNQALYSTSKTSNVLHQLAWVYDAANRHEDVIRLLDKAPLWAGTDIADLRSYHSVPTSMEVIAAKAFAATGKREIALKIIKEAIHENAGQDAAHEVLVSLNDGGTEAFLDEVFAQNRFQERPLIWKAKILSDQGKLDEAEKTIRQAIAIDPSDGEQGKGDRMRAYRVLGGIFDKRGDKEQVKFMESIDKAIRTAEEADDWWAAGIHTQAVKLYETALRSFADAYCIQSRLALRYAEMGDMEKAAQYYQRAFELMPDSFGRVESHCFGCEGAFKGTLAQGIAERVFTGLAAKPPVKPQVYYLLGYLRDSQERPKEAAEFYRKAVEADPDYLNAWQKLMGVSEKAGLKPEEVDQAILATYRLGGNPNFGSFSNLRLLWETLSEDKKLQRVPAKTLYPLAASALRINANPDMRRYLSGYRQEKAPREQMAQVPSIQRVTSLIQHFVRSN